MSISVYGVVADTVGGCVWPGEHWERGRDGPRLKRTITVSCDPGERYAPTHRAPMPVKFEDHAGPPIGRVVHLERRAGVLHAVAVVDDWRHALAVTRAATGGRLRWSSATTQRGSGLLNMDHLALTEHPASHGLPAVRVVAGDVTSTGWKSSGPPSQTPRILQRAHQAPVEVRSAGTMRVVEIDDLDRPLDQRSSDLEWYDRMEHSHSGHYADAVLAVR